MVMVGPGFLVSKMLAKLHCLHMHIEFISRCESKYKKPAYMCSSKPEHIFQGVAVLA